MQERSDSILISIHTADAHKKLERDVSRLDSAIVGELVRHAYRQGYDEIVLTHNSVEHLERLRNLLPQLLGYVMMRQDQEECRIVSLSKEIDLTFDGALDTALSTVQEMLTRLRDYRHTDRAWLDTITLREQDVQKLCNFCHRQLSKGAVGAEAKSDYVCLIEELQGTVRLIPALGERLVTAGRPEGLTQAIVLLARQFQSVQTFAAARQPEDAEHILSMGQQVLEQLTDVGSGLSAHGKVAEHMIKRISDSITHLSLAHLFVTDQYEGGEGDRSAAEAAA